MGQASRYKVGSYIGNKILAVLGVGGVPVISLNTAVTSAWLSLPQCGLCRRSVTFGLDGM